MRYNGISFKEKGVKTMEQQNNPASIEELFLITKNHYDLSNHVMTMPKKGWDEYVT